MRGIVRIMFSTSFIKIIAVCSLLAAAESASAEGLPRIFLGSGVTQKVEVSVGKSVLIESPGAVKRLSIAAPEIADALILTPYQIYITGKAAGITNLTIWNGHGSAVSAVFNIDVVPDVTRLKEKIHELLPHEGDIRVSATSEYITLSGTVSNVANLSQVLTLAQAYAPLDKTGKPKVLNCLEAGGVQQVMLEVRVSEMSRSLIKKLGVNFNFISQSGQQFGASLLGNVASLPGSGTFPSTPLSASSNVNFLFQFLGAGSTWTFFIDALKDEGLLKVLAEPTLIALSGKSADFLAGGEYPIPVPQPSAGGSIITIQYKPYGVALKFIPTVLNSGRINMQIAPEVSELDFSNAVQLQGYLVPALTTRRVSTSIELADGQSFAIAGLLHDEVRQDIQKFPILGDLPVLGALFRSSAFQKNSSELVIIATAHLVKPLDMSKQTLPTDQYIEPDDYEFLLLGRQEGREKEKTSGPSSSPGSLWGLRSAGLEGNFGHILP